MLFACVDSRVRIVIDTFKLGSNNFFTNKTLDMLKKVMEFISNM